MANNTWKLDDFYVVSDKPCLEVFTFLKISSVLVCRFFFYYEGVEEENQNICQVLFKRY